MTRLLSDPASPEAIRNLLRQAVNDGPSEQELSLLLSGVDAEIDGSGSPDAVGGAPESIPAPGPVPLAASVSGAGAGVLLKVVGAGAVLGALVVGWHLTTAPAPKAPVPSPSVVTAKVLEHPPTLAPALSASESAPSVIAPETASPARGPRRQSVSEPSASSPVLAPRAVSETKAEVSALYSASAEPPAAHAPAQAPANSRTGAEEIALLNRAQRALSSDASGALTLIEEHRRRFTASSFVEEREVIAIEALVRLGRRSEARDRFERFNRRFQQSPHRARLQALWP